MEILKFENAGTPRKVKKSNTNLKSLAGLATVAAIAVLGSTLAANISLGSASGIEFGQGVQVTSACDSDGITVTPTTTFKNAAGAGTFYLSTIAFTGVDLSSTSKCQGKTFSLNAYGDSSATPLQLATDGSSNPVTNATFAIKNDGTNTGTSAAGVTLSGITSASSNGALTLSFATPSSTSGAVYKLTLQSSN